MPDPVFLCEQTSDLLEPPQNRCFNQAVYSVLNRDLCPGCFTVVITRVVVQQGNFVSVGPALKGTKHAQT